MADDALDRIGFDDVRGKRVLVALSGGADSVALLILLAEGRVSYDLTLFAAHLNHGIRGHHADEDAAWCRSLCRDLGIGLYEESADVPALARKSGLGLETAARNARYDFLRRAREKCAADVIALAHHRDDQAETILMHLLRGSGPEGVCGMARLKDKLYRPLLDVPKSALKQFLEKRGVAWREDATNAHADNPRNILRLNVLPEIEGCYPQAACAIARYGRLARIESDFVEKMTRRFLSQRLERGPYGARILLDGSEEEAIMRRAVRILAGEGLDSQQTDAVIALCRKPRGRLALSGHLMIEKTPSALYFLPPQKKHPSAVPLRLPGQTCLENLCRIEAEMGSYPMEGENPLVELMDADALRGAVLRTRRDGDHIHPLGAPGERLLSDYLTDKKIDRPLRDCMPLIARGNKILWACGTGIAHCVRITPETVNPVRLSLCPITNENMEVRL